MAPWTRALAALIPLLIAAACTGRPVSQEAGPGGGGTPMPTLEKASFGTTPEGRAVDLYTLANGRGLRAKIITYGGILVALEVPDREGRTQDVVLGFDTLDAYLAGHPYFGALIGRYANRIAGARFSLDGRAYQLAANNGPNHLHGGERGFDKALWEARGLVEPDAAGVALALTSPDGEEGYPGDLEVSATYRLTSAGELRISYEARAGAPTPVNLTHHSYFNLAGQGSGDVLGHVVTLHADGYTEVDEGLIPTGTIAPVAGTPFDFTRPTAIGARIGLLKANNPQGGYDHNFVLRGKGGELCLAARVREPRGGRVLEVWTTEPGLQFYTGNFLDGTLVGKGGAVYGQHAGFCMEAQHFPDSPNRPAFPSTLLEPGRVYRQETVYRFGVEP